MAKIRFIESPQQLKLGRLDVVNVLGNGPSLKDIPLDFEFEGFLIGMNRIDSFVMDRGLQLDAYIFVTDNIENEEWGSEWLGSLENGTKHSKLTIISSEVYEYLKASNFPESHTILSANLVVLSCIKEPRLYLPNSVVEPTAYFTKSGTSINLAVQISMLGNPQQLNFFGVDLGWVSTSKIKQSDPNHYHSSYFARINSGFFENARMHLVHDRLASIFKKRKIMVRNFSPRTIVDCYDQYGFDGDLVKSKNGSLNKVVYRNLLVLWDEVTMDLKRIIVRVLRLLKLRH